MNNGKLYVKGTCTVCRGKRIGCYCCDADGLTFIEAADSIIIQWLSNLSSERRQQIIQEMQNKLKERE